MGAAIWKACGPVALPLLLLSVAVFTVAFDRFAFWWRWWRRPAVADVDVDLARLQRQMASGEPVLQAAVGLAPLFGLLGTVSGLMGVLRALGPQLLLPAQAPLAGYADVLLSTLIGLQITAVAASVLVLNQGLRRWQLQRLRLALRLGRSQ
ncbi:MAG: MotA/TolQ/ExbB proton channel family protein [Cyanobacteriota bacterium]